MANAGGRQARRARSAEGSSRHAHCRASLMLARTLGGTGASSTYQPRRAEESVLYGIVQEHLATFLAHVREQYEAPLPRYVEDAFRSFLACGVFARGFIR
jgi:hypothetical protein